MKSTGIVRRVDELGRVVIPKELRRTHAIEEGDPLEIFTDDGGKIILRKYEPSCIFCGQAKNMKFHKGKNICSDCITELRK
jgi:transcriptional pleiotropic regulator of transition state genes